MKGSEELFLLLCFSKLVFGDVFYNLINREDPCINLCEKVPQSITNSEYVKSCCQRGCRFFNLVDIQILHKAELESVNSTRDACKASCIEAYTGLQARSACSTGCDFMARQRVADLLSLCSIAIYVEEGLDSNVLLMSPDMPENDILSDPGLRKELLPGWWDSNGFKLPQTYIKTVPMDSGTVDYGPSSDYSVETERSVLQTNDDWLDCASRHTGIPQWLLASAISATALSALWLYLSPDKSNEPNPENNEGLIISNKVHVYLPDEEPLYKVPPPKYSEVVATDNTDPKV